MAIPRLTYADLPPEIWGQEICRTLDDYARAALLYAAEEFLALLADIAPPVKRCHYCCGDPSNATLRNSVAAGHVACVKAQLPDSPKLGWRWPMGLTDEAATHGRIAVLRLLRSRGCPLYGGETSEAAKGGHIETLRVLRQLGCPWSGRETHWAAYSGHIKTLRVLRLEMDRPWSGTETYAAVCEGRTETLRVLRELGCEWSGNETLWAAGRGQTETLRVLRKELGCPWTGQEISWAASYGHTETLRVLREEPNCPE